MAVTRGSRSPDCSSEREKWRKIFKAMTEMLQKKQTQVESLFDERKFLEDRIKTLCDRFSEDSKLFDRFIDQVNRNLKICEMSSAVQSAKADMLLGLKNTEAFFYKLKSDNLQSELVDFRTCIDHLSLKQSTGMGGGGEEEMEELKREHGRLLSEKEAEISALRAEQGFVWNQYRLMEGDYTAKLKQKQKEVELSTEKADALFLSLERLRSEAAEKDGTIEGLRAADSARMEATAEGAKSTPPTGFASAVTAARPARGPNRCGFRQTVSTARSGERFPSAANRPPVSTQKRKHLEDDEVLVTPLFTSSFKIPKLKK